jgi:3-phosphoshikimate 1-carboxyvinyltransferase
MGANIIANRSLPVLHSEEYPPISIVGSELTPIKYKMPVASAQVKSAILLAGLYAKGCTEIIEPLVCRDHTERMLKVFKSKISIKRNKIRIYGRKELLSPGKVYVPGDISSAAFFMVAAAIVPNSQLRIKNVSLNPTRTGLLNVLKRMGADIRVQARGGAQGEPLGDLIVKHSQLKHTMIKNKEIPFLIDELPVLMVAACFAKGKSIFKGVKELRVKETDRIRSMCFNLKKMGAKIKVRKSGNDELIEIEGVKALNGAELKSFGDHRTAMSAIVAGLAANGSSHIDDIECIKKSFPGFLPVLKGLLLS